MISKLTLTIDDNVITNAKHYAKTKGKSLSKLVESYLTALTVDEGQNDKISPHVLKLMGSVELPPDFDYKQELKKGIRKKYSK